MSGKESINLEECIYLNNENPKASRDPLKLDPSCFQLTLLCWQLLASELLGKTLKQGLRNFVYHEHFQNSVDHTELQAERQDLIH